ncbi:hypothetical protein [Sphingomonas sp. G-3-2-10]|uniref:hypothetical protein n=1 Tax=Sphingomonas sp. G-3-2-10 TaxID=2728838 RepID=UPI00146F084E|nr:hypothetical protein [Sphingomonas sp. G-3-2-10]NML05322.1 hypothetical protein [Sphingomonas sp. G-3-2-10]
MIFEVGALLLAALTGQSAPDPLAPAREGKLQCTAPNVAKKKCLAMSRYSATPGGYRNTTIVVISAAPLITMELASDARIVGDAVCAQLRHEDILAATIAVEGQAMPAADAAPLIDRMAGGMKEMFGKTVCSRFRVEGEAMVSEAEIDGAPQPDMTMKFIWVGPEDGYAVGWEAG